MLSQERERPTYLSEATRQLIDLSRAVELEPFEPQADEATLEAFQARALEFVGVLDQQYQDTVSLDRPSRVKEPTDIPFLFALDLNPGPDSRVKVYFEHPNGMAVDIAAKLAAICPETNPKEVEHFLVAMSGDSPGPYRGKPAGTCIAFKMGEDCSLKTPEGTMHFPIPEYTPHDQESSETAQPCASFPASSAASVHAWGPYGGQYDRDSDIRGRPWANNDGSLPFGGVDSSVGSSDDADYGFGYWTGNGNGDGFQDGRPDFPSGDAMHYREVHGILAAIAFVGLFPLGSIFVRVIPGRFAWIVHAITQTVAYIVFIGAAVLGLYLVNTIQIPPNGASLLEISAVNVHPIVGIVILALLLFQPILGLVHHAKFKRLGRRTAWSHLHLWNGRAMVTLGIVNGGLGLGLACAPPGSIAAYSAVAAIVWLLWVLAAAYGELRWRWGRGAEGEDGEEKTEGAGRASGRGGGRGATMATTTTTAVTSSSGNSDGGAAAGEPWTRPDTPTPPYTPGPAGPDLAVYGGPGLNNTPTGNNTMGLPMEQEKQLDRLP
ncbi:hypothetical protein DL767_010918 [Monosporascus sp. MG133]|nr:hypothetical protein DL767_010918 [Monosporascus sp. MG133]